MENVTAPAEGFSSTGLSPVILSIVEGLSLTVPTPIQAKAIPIAMKGSDIIGVAQTGTGKTLAFALPLLEKLLKSQERGLVLVPTRELALQVEESIRRVAGRLNPQIRTICLIGGMSMYVQTKALRYNPRIIIATPGRLQDHMNQGNVKLDQVTTLILDEADRMLDMGFLPQIKKIIEAIPTNRQTMLFSATMAPEIARLAGAYMKDPIRVEVAQQGTASHHIEQQICYLSHDKKPDVLRQILDKYATGPILVFTRTKHGASKLSERLIRENYASAEIHSNRSLGQRRQALDGFKSGRYRVLVATDVAARGIDVHNIAVVVNYDLPDAAEDYVHRIGRTGRAGNAGLAISLAGHDQVRDVKVIERLMNRKLDLSEYSETPQERSSFQARPASGSSAPHQRGGRSFPAQGARRNHPHRREGVAANGSTFKIHGKPVEERSTPGTWMSRSA